MTFRSLPTSEWTPNARAVSAIDGWMAVVIAVSHRSVTGCRGASAPPGHCTPGPPAEASPRWDERSLAAIGTDRRTSTHRSDCGTPPSTTGEPAGCAITQKTSRSARSASEVPGGHRTGDYGDTVIGPDGQVFIVYQDPTGGEGPATDSRPCRLSLNALYSRSVSRVPVPTITVDPSTTAVDDGGPARDPKLALGDVFWALLNSSEFLMNH